jgi:RNA polymerase sigma-70 factor, ECF subfamily
MYFPNCSNSHNCRLMKEEKDLLEDLRRGNREAFSALFDKYYRDLVLFAGHFIHDKNRCEDIVQGVFLKVWASREQLAILSSLKSFLLKSVQNSCLDELRHLKVVREHELYAEAFYRFDSMETEQYVLYSDLKGQLEKALDQLPLVCRQVFRMNRFEGLKYREIAQQLDVSERTIEVRMGKALHLLRTYLDGFFAILLALLTLFMQIYDVGNSL